MRYLRLPEGLASVTVFDQTYGKDGVIAGPDGKGVEDHIAKEIMAHDPRITEFTPDGADDPRTLPGGADKHVAFIARVAALDRTELFALGRSMRISLPATLRTENLREIVVRHSMTMAPQDLPMIALGAAQADSSGMVMLNPDDAASPNRGNDGLGSRALAPGATGATFSQNTLGGIVPVAPASAAPAEPAVHAGEPVLDHGAIDAHETNAAMAISEAADRLTDANAKK